MAKVSGKIAKRYAKALFDLCDPKELELMRDALRALSSVIEDHQELRLSLQNPGVPIEERILILSDLARLCCDNGAGPNAEILKNFLAVVLSNGRITGLRQVEEQFSKMIEELKKILRLEVSSAFPMPDDEKQVLQKAAEDEYGSLATINWEVDQELLGGMCVKNGDRLLDSSIRGALERARGALLS